MTFGPHQPPFHPRTRSNPRRRSAVLAALVSAALLVLAACGTAPGITLVLDSATAELVRGAAVEIEVTLTRTGGAAADIALDVTGLPTNVSASFSPATLSGATLTSTLTLSAAAAATEGSYDLTVTGTGTGLVASADLGLEVVGLDVTGRVVTIFDIALPNVSVRSQGASAVTDADGTFSLTGLSVPYDLSLWSTTQEWVHVFEGLTSDELLLAPFAESPPLGSTSSTTVSGNLSGGVVPVAANQAVIVCLDGLDGFIMGCTTADPSESSYSISAQWLGSTTRQARLHALQVERDASGYVVGYLGYATMAMNLSNGVPTLANLDLGSALETTTVTVTIDSPAPVGGMVGALLFGPSTSPMAVMTITNPVVTHEVLVPVIPDISYTFVASSGSGLGWHASTTGTTATVTVPAVPSLVAPATLMTGVTQATDFTVTNPTGGPATYLWNADVGALTIALTTMDTTTTIPDLGPYGLALPVGADFSWQLMASSGDSVDSGTSTLLDYYGIITLMSSMSSGLTGEGTFAISETWEFTTAP